MSLPIVQLRGTPYEQGQQHGDALRNQIAHNLALYFDRFEREVKLHRSEVLARAERYLAAIEQHNSDYHASLRGVADASGFDLLELAALNVRYEILYYQFGVNAMADGCTAFAILPDASDNGHLIIGQNWDWIPHVQGAVLHTTHADGMQTLAFTEAGIVGGKIGLNSAGVGLAINGITTTDDDWTRLSKPFHVRCYEILRSRSFDQAVRVVTDEPRACSTNYLIAGTPDQVVDIEAAPGAMRVLGCEQGCLVHTNHFVDPDALGIVEPPNENRPYSRFRLERLRDLMVEQQPLGVGTMQTMLRDHRNHPYSVCRHADPAQPPEEHYVTITAVVMDLNERMLYLTDGPPCEAEYQTVALA